MVLRLCFARALKRARVLLALISAEERESLPLFSLVLRLSLFVPQHWHAWLCASAREAFYRPRVQLALICAEKWAPSPNEKPLSALNESAVAKQAAEALMV